MAFRICLRLFDDFAGAVLKHDAAISLLTSANTCLSAGAKQPQADKSAHYRQESGLYAGKVRPWPDLVVDQIHLGCIGMSAYRCSRASDSSSKAPARKI